MTPITPSGRLFYQCARPLWATPARQPLARWTVNPRSTPAASRCRLRSKSQELPAGKKYCPRQKSASPPTPTRSSVFWERLGRPPAAAKAFQGLLYSNCSSQRQSLLKFFGRFLVFTVAVTAVGGQAHREINTGGIGRVTHLPSGNSGKP